MMEDYAEKDAYAENLAKVNETNHVIAASDICNAQGQIIAKKGTRIDSALTERITRFKLMRPLEHSIVIENELTATSLAECFSVYLQGDASTAHFFKRYHDPNDLLSLCEKVVDDAIIRQKITVMSLILPSVFEQAMFCAWFGYLIARKSAEQGVAPDDLFVAGMCHDLGMIHIPSDILNKKTDLTPEEWRQIHVHPIIGYNILKETPGISKNVARAVIEHHENIDGTGYPRSRPGENLTFEGQLLNLLDGVNAIYLRRCKPHNRPLSDLIPIVQISRHSRFGPLAKKMIVLLRELPKVDTHRLPDEHIEDIIKVVKGHGKYINTCVEIAKHMVSAIGFRHENLAIASIQNSIFHISMSIVQSGIINDAYMRWLDQVGKEKLAHAYKELEEAFLMMQEIIYQISRLKMLIELYLDRHPSSAEAVILADKVSQMSDHTKPPISQPLADLWLFSA